MPPIRLQKILSDAGLASRREAEEWIREGRVRVNGRIVQLGERADPERDAIRVDGRRIRPRSGVKTYILLNKPKGYVTTLSDPQQRHTVIDLLPENLRRGIKPVGRLDVQTEGLLLLTDDGDLAARVAHPRSACGKEYRVKVSGVPAEGDLDRLRRGVFLDGARTRPCQITRVSTTGARGEGNAWLRVTLQEGRTRQIRRMFETIGHPVSKLKRTAIGPIRDERLPPGAHRRLAAREVEALQRSLGRGDGRKGGKEETGRTTRRGAKSSEPLIVAIDGPSGAGKSTVARALAARLGVPYIDTGAMYRAVGLAAWEAGMPLPLTDPDRVVALAQTHRIGLEPSGDGLRVFWNGRDVSEGIRQPEISLYASAVSAISGVRRCLVADQRRLARGRGGVLEGRDIGTRVFPETPHKFFLTASAEVRAQRRARELAERGSPRPDAVVLEEMARRDRDDSTRADSPLTLDDRYTVVDSTGKRVSQVVSEIEARIREQGKLTRAAPAT